MLDLFRKKSQSPFIQAIVIAIALVFVFLGVGSYQKGDRNEAASVNGESITFEQFRNTYEREYENFRQQYGQDVPKQMIESGSFKNGVLEKMISQVLLMQGAHQMGIVVSDPEVQEKIQEMPFLKSAGIFDLDRYRNVLTSMRKSATDFEASVRNDLMMDKALARINGFPQVTEKEIQDRYSFASSEIKLEYVPFLINDYKEKVEVTDEALTAFFEERQEKYKTDRQVKVRYLFFNFTEIGKGINPTDEEILKNYDENPERYDVQEKRSARHILVKNAEDATLEVKAEKRKKAEDILARIKTGEDFATLAKELSEDTASGKQGGDLGFFSRGRMVKSFDEAVFSLEPGAVSEVVETTFGFHIIKLEEVQPAHIIALDEVRDEIVAHLKYKGGKDLAFLQANQAYKDIIAAGSIEQYIEKSGVEMVETDFITKRESGDVFQKRGKLLRALFNLKKGELSSLVEGGKEYAILFLVDEKLPEVPALETVGERVEKDFIAHMAKKKAQEDSESLLASLKTGSSMEIEAEKLSKKVLETEYYSRRDKWPNHFPKAFSTLSYSLSAKNPYPESVAEQNNVYYVYALKESKEASLSLLLQGRQEAIKESVQPEKRQAVLSAWVSNLREKAEVTINPNF